MKENANLPWCNTIQQVSDPRAENERSKPELAVNSEGFPQASSFLVQPSDTVVAGETLLNPGSDPKSLQDLPGQAAENLSGSPAGWWGGPQNCSNGGNGCEQGQTPGDGDHGDYKVPEPGSLGLILTGVATALALKFRPLRG